METVRDGYFIDDDDADLEPDFDMVRTRSCRVCVFGYEGVG